MDTFFDQPCNMSVCQFGRITLRLARNGFDTKLVNLSGGSRREYESEFQCFEEGRPERIVFVNVQDSWHSDDSAGCFFLTQRFIVKDTMQLIFKEVRNLFFVFLFSDTFFTSVSGDVLTVSGKFVDGEQAVIGTSTTAGQFCLKFQIIDLFDGQHSGLFAFITVTGNQCSAEGTHDTGDIRTDCFASGNGLKASQDSIVVEGTALNDDVLTKFCRIRQLDNFE